MPYRQTEGVQARLTDNRARLLQAARNQVSEGGWEQAQVSGIAAAAGMATGNVYRYFPSKADLFAEVVAEVSGRELAVMQDIARSGEPPAQRLHTAVATFVRRAMRNPQLAYSMIAEPCDKAIDAERLKWRARISECILKMIVDAQRAGVARDGLQPDIAATVIVGGFMEALVGPLSPLNKHAKGTQEQRKRHVEFLAQRIAATCCGAVLTTRRRSPAQ